MRLAALIFLPLSALLAHAQWQIQDSHTKESLRGVSVVNANVVWASGTHGTYIVSTDGGGTWTPHQMPGAADLDFRGVKAFGAEAFLLAAGPGDKSRIYHTNDFGQHWEMQFTNPEPKGFFDCMAFANEQHGIAVGDPVNGKFQILRTDDGGTNWRLNDPQNMPPAIDGEGAFAASNSCIAVRGQNIWFASGGTVARVFRSADGGRTWTVAETPVKHGASSQGIFSIAFADNLRGVIAGGDYAQPEQGRANLAVTNDGGKTWQSVSVQPQKFFSALAYLGNRSGRVPILAVGSSASAFSQDDLHSWKFFVPQGFSALDSSGSAVFAAGPNGSVAKAALR